MNGPTIDDVAEAAGVHRSTVSRAFSRPEAVKAATRIQVLRVAEELGYTMSPLAQALRRKTSNLVPLIVPDITNPFFAELAKTMTAAAGKRGYQLLLCLTDGDSVQTKNYLAAMESMYAPFGVIAPSTKVDIESLRHLAFLKRVVVIDRLDEELGIPTVTVDSGKGIELAFAHLRELGHASIAYVTGISGTHTAQDRLEAFHALANQHGLPALVIEGGTQAAEAEAAVESYLGLVDRPTAIIAANDMIAFGFISSLGRRGIRVPEDVSVIGFDGLALGERFNPQLTTIQQPIASMGKIAIDLALRLTSDEGVGHVVLQPNLLTRSSTASPSR